jgi:thiol-disulfide isomerase/thioredoxin
MKYFSGILLFLLSFSVSAQDGIQFFEGSFEEAKNESAKQNKLIFMDAYTVWCGPCKRMAAEVFPQKQVGDFFNKNFINMKVDMEKGEGRDIAKKYGIYSYPTLLFIDSEGNVVTFAKGMRNAEGLIDLGKKALLPNPVEVAKLEAQYVSGEKGAAFLKDYIKVKAALGDDYDGPFSDLIRQMSTDEKLEKSNATFIFQHLNHINSPALEVVGAFLSYFRDLFGNELDTRLLTIAEAQVQEAVRNIDETSLKLAMDFLNKYKPAGYEERAGYLELVFYAQTGKWALYDKAATRYVKKHKNPEANILRELAWNYYLFIEDIATLKKAEKWAAQAVHQEDNYQNNLTLAYLQFKLNKNAQSLQSVEKAIELAGSDFRQKENASMLKNQIENRLKEKNK